MNLFVCYPKCSTCKKAENWLKEQKVPYDLRDIKQENPSKEELAAWYEKSGLEMKLKDRLPSMTDDEKLDLLATDGMLVKRPILVTQDCVLVGFKEKEWEAAVACIQR